MKNTITILCFCFLFTSCTETKDELGEHIIKYSIFDHYLNRNVASANFAYSSSDITVDERFNSNNEIFYSKFIQLNPDFAVGASIYPKPNPGDITGFGLWTRNLKVNSFCWEWFVVKNSSFADKLQEEGGVEFDLVENNGKFQLNSIRFMTDVKFRITDFDNEDFNVVSPELGSECRWSCTISKGSSISF